MAHQGQPGGRRRVIVAEGDRSVLRVLRFALEEAGFSVAEAATCDRAARLLEESPPDAVVLDVDSPWRPGGGLPPCLKPPVGRGPGAPVWVAISAQDRADVVRLYGGLWEGFIAKPLDPWELAGLLERLLTMRDAPGGGGR